MKQSTHSRMCLDVLRMWEDELGFEIDSFVKNVVERANRSIDGAWKIHRNGKILPVPHHRTRLFRVTGTVLMYHLLTARHYWLGIYEGKLHKSDQNVATLVRNLTYAMHIAQDLCVWSMEEPKHTMFEESVDRVYRPLKKKYGASRKKIFETYVLFDERYQETQERPEPYVRTAFRKSSELVSYVVSKRKLREEKAEALVKKYGLYVPQVLEEVRYWNKAEKPVRVAAGVVLGTTIAGRLLHLWTLFVGAVILYVPFFVGAGITYVLCKIGESVKNNMKYDMYPDAPELAASAFSAELRSVGVEMTVMPI